jgi:V8-like Glu-specific endopeptidase
MRKNKPVKDMNYAPYNAIGRLDIKLNIDGKYFSFHGTGTLIGVNLVITAAHNVYHRESLT